MPPETLLVAPQAQPLLGDKNNDWHRNEWKRLTSQVLLLLPFLTTEFRERMHRRLQKASIRYPVSLPRPAEVMSAHAILRAGLASPKGEHCNEVKREVPIDIIVCVHNALEDVKRCLDLLVACTLAPYRIIIVDDGSNSECASYLRSFSEEQCAILLRNEKALGYTFAANRGLRVSTGEWVVLLNSDTIVTYNWLDKMWRHSVLNPRVGVIGPLSNTASWQSIPNVFTGNDWSANELPAGTTISDVSEILNSLHRPSVRMDFINGFCYMLSRAVIEKCGFFLTKKILVQVMAKRMIIVFGSGKLDFSFVFYRCLHFSCAIKKLFKRT